MLHSAFAAHWSKVLLVLSLHTKGSLNTSLICGCPLCVGLSGAACCICSTLVWRCSRKISDVQIGRKGGNGIKVNGQVTANRFWKKKSRKWHSWVRRSLQRFGQVCLNWSELSSRRRQIFSRIFMDAIFILFYPVCQWAPGWKHVKTTFQNFFRRQRQSHCWCWINISLYLI